MFPECFQNPDFQNVSMFLVLRQKLLFLYVFKKTTHLAILLLSVSSILCVHKTLYSIAIFSSHIHWVREKVET